MEESDFWKTLTPEEQNDQREFFKQDKMGMLDYVTLHEYEIYNPDGTFNMTVYGKDSTEADKKAASLGTGYTVKDTNKVKFQMASTLTSTPTTTILDSSGKPLTPETSLAQIKKEGGNYTLADVVSYQDEKGVLPSSKSDLVAWDSEQENIKLWERLDSSYSDGALTVGGETPKISTEDAKKIVDAKLAGDARANKFFVEDVASKTIAPEGMTLDQILMNMWDLQGVNNGNAGGVESSISKEVVQAINDNVGKMITIDNKNYIVIGPGVVNPSDAKSTTGFNTEMKTGSRKWLEDLGGIEVFNVETREREILSPYTIKGLGDVDPTSVHMIMKSVPQIATVKDANEYILWSEKNNIKNYSTDDRLAGYQKWLESKGQ
jgi:hypothetical protein